MIDADPGLTVLVWELAVADRDALDAVADVDAAALTLGDAEYVRDGVGFAVLDLDTVSEPVDDFDTVRVSVSDPVADGNAVTVADRDSDAVGVFDVVVDAVVVMLTAAATPRVSSDSASTTPCRAPHPCMFTLVSTARLGRSRGCCGCEQPALPWVGCTTAAQAPVQLFIERQSWSVVPLFPSLSLAEV